MLYEIHWARITWQTHWQNGWIPHQWSQRCAALCAPTITIKVTFTSTLGAHFLIEQILHKNTCTKWAFHFDSIKFCFFQSNSLIACYCCCSKMLIKTLSSHWPYFDNQCLICTKFNINRKKKQCSPFSLAYAMWPKACVLHNIISPWKIPSGQ